MLHYYGYVLYTYLFIKLISLLMHKIVPHPYLCKLSPEVFFLDLSLLAVSLCYFHLILITNRPFGVQANRKVIPLCHGSIIFRAKG